MQLAAEVNEFFDTGISEGIFKVDRYSVEKARAALLGYVLHYGEESNVYEVVGVEVPFCLPLPEVDEYHNGFIDLLLRRKSDGGIIVRDLKTASSAGLDYFQELYTNEQLTEYITALRQSGYENVIAQWDVIVKPTIDPKKVTKEGKAEIETGHYCGLPCSDTTIQADGKESPVQYGLRCLVWYLEEPDKRFVRRTYTRSDEEILEHINNLQRRVVRNKCWEQDYHDMGLLPVKHLEQCKRYGRMCDYHHICSGADPQKVQFKEKEAPQDRTPMVGVSVSRLRTADRCPREYHYKYVEKIEPITRIQSDATDLGSLIHSGFEYLMRKRLVKDEIVLPVEGNQ